MNELKPWLGCDLTCCFPGDFRSGFASGFTEHEAECHRDPVWWPGDHDDGAQGRSESIEGTALRLAITTKNIYNTESNSIFLIQGPVSHEQPEGQRLH